MPGDQVQTTPDMEKQYEEMLKRLPPMARRRELYGEWLSEKPASDRGMSLPSWQDWIVELLIKKHDEGCSDNQLRMMFATEFDRRFGNGAK
jgi:hypothetical protein